MYEMQGQAAEEIIQGGMMEQLTREQAIELAKSGVWKGWSSQLIAGFQLFQDNLCIPFDIFHKAIEDTLGRSVWTHEFGVNRDGLIAEYLGKAPKPSMEDIINMIPEEKRVIIGK